VLLEQLVCDCLRGLGEYGCLVKFLDNKGGLIDLTELVLTLCDVWESTLFALKDCSCFFERGDQRIKI
jgi:hypothetical protein